MAYGAILGQTPKLDVFSKEDILTQQTAELFGLDANSVPNDVFAFLGKYNLYWWRRKKPDSTVNVVQEIVSDINTGSIVPRASNVHPQVTYSGSYQFNGTSVSVSGSVWSPSYTENAAVAASLINNSPLVGSYFQTGDDVFYLSGDITDINIVTVSSGFAFGIEAGTTQLKHVKVVQQTTTYDWEYLYSSDENAYPKSGTTGEYQYQYLGIPFENAVLANVQ